MKKNSKIICLMLGISLLAGSFASCAKRNDNSSSSSDSSSSQTQSSSSEEKQTIAEAVKLLDDTPYASSEVTENYGLSAASSVGVKSEETKETLYAGKADGEFKTNCLIDFESFSGTDDEKMTQTLSSAKTENKEGEKVKIKFPSRDIVLTSAVTLSGFDGLYLEGGENTQFLMDCSTVGWISALSVSSCKDLHINGLDIDYKVLPSIVGIVVSSDTETLSVTMSIPQSMRSTVDAYLANPALYSQLCSVIEFNRFTGAPEEDGIVAISGEGVFESWKFNGNGEITLTFKDSYRSSFKAPAKNAPVSLAFTMYNRAGVTFSDCENVFVEDVDLYSCPGMGVTVSGTKNFYANRLDIVLKDEDRRMTSTADGYHISNCLGEVKITNCIIENTHDDALNIKSGYWYTLGSYDAQARTFNVSKKTGASPMTEVGDTVEFYDSATFERLGSFTVTEVSGDTGAMQLTVKQRISGSVDWSNAMMTNVSKVAEFTFKNNIVRNKRNRGILVQVRGALIENNAFLNVGHGSMQIASAMDQYNECTLPKDIVIRNNKLINNGYLLGEGLRGDISAFAIGSGALVAPSGTVTGIEVTNNYISNTGNAGISFRGVGDSTVKNNLFYNTARVYASILTECCIELENCAALTIDGNYNYNTNDSESFSGIIPSGTTKMEDIALTNNVNLKYQEIDGDVPNTVVSKLACGTITVDGDISEWENIGSEIAMDGASLTTGDEILHDAYKDVFDVLMCKIAWTDEGIYFAFNIYDNKLDFKTIANFWEGDCAEFFLSTVTDMPNADFQLFKNDGDVLQMSVVPSWNPCYTVAESRTNAAIAAGRAHISAAAALRSDGYSGEVFLPFSLLQTAKTSIDEGKSIAMAFVFMDADRDDIGRKRIQVSNVPHFVEAYKTKTAKMPVFTFVD